MESKKWKLNKEDMKQVAIKLVMFIISIGLPELIKELNLIDFGQYQGLASSVIFALQYGSQRLLKGKA